MVANFFSAAVTWLANAGRMIITGLFDGIKGAWEFVKWWWTDMPTVVKGLLANAGTWLFNIGKDIINGLWDGLKNAWTAVANWVSDKVSWIIDSFKDALSIRSPSRVFEEIGRNIGEGLVLGMQSMEPEIDQELSTMLTVPKPDTVRSASMQQGRSLNYYAAPNKSLDAEQELRLAMVRARVLA